MLLVAALRVPVHDQFRTLSIGLVVLQCSAPLVLDSKCLVGIDTSYKILHLSSTIELDGLLVQFALWRSSAESALRLLSPIQPSILADLLGQ